MSNNLPKNGGMEDKRSILPYKNPMPVGPHIWNTCQQLITQVWKSYNSKLCKQPYLVRGSNKKVNIKALNINRHVWNTLTGIYKNFCSNIMCPMCNISNTKNRSYRETDYKYKKTHSFWLKFLKVSDKYYYCGKEEVTDWKCMMKDIPRTFETWWTTTILVFPESISFNLSISGISSWFKFTNFKTAPTFWATSCHGTIALWCSATVSMICNDI